MPQVPARDGLVTVVDMASDRPGAHHPFLPSAGVPPWLERSGAVAVRLLALGVLVWLVAELATTLTLLLVALAVGVLLGGVLDPVVRWGERHGVARWVTALAAVLLVLAFVVGLVVTVGSRLADQLPRLLDDLQSATQQLSQTLGVELPSLGGSGGSGSTPGADQALGALRGLADVLVGMFLALAFAFLLLKDGHRMWTWFLGKLGGRLRDDVDAAGHAAWRTTGYYVRGLTVVALFDAVGIGLGLLVLGVPLVLTLAVLQFVASYIPTIGSFVAGAVAVAVAWVSGGVTTALIALAIVLVVQQVGNDVIEPWVMGRDLPINAIMVLIAVTAGGLLWGIAGALLFVPLTAAVSAAAHELWTRHGSRPIAGGA